MTELTELVKKLKKKYCEYNHKKRKKHFGKGCPDCELMDKFIADLQAFFKEKAVVMPCQVCSARAGKKMTSGTKAVPLSLLLEDDISICKKGCGCMTKTIDGKCGKCKEVKP